MKTANQILDEKTGFNNQWKQATVDKIESAMKDYAEERIKEVLDRITKNCFDYHNNGEVERKNITPDDILNTDYKDLLT